MVCRIVGKDDIVTKGAAYTDNRTHTPATLKVKIELWADIMI